MAAQTSEGTIHSTFVIERSYGQAVERVFAAFTEPAQKRRWYAEGDHDIKEFQMDFRVGGHDRFSYRFREGHPIAGSEIVNDGTYQEIAPGKRIVMTSKMSLNGKAIVVMLATIEFERSGTGTNLVFTHQGTFIEWPAGVQMIEAGWRGLFERLEKYLAQQG